MGAEHAIAVLGGLIIGLILALVSLFFTQKSNNFYGQTSENPKTSGSDQIKEIQQEFEKLRIEIDAIKRKNARTRPASTISSGYDYKSARDELDVADYDLLDQWNRTSKNFYGDSEEATEIYKKLKAIDQKLDDDDRREIERVLEELENLCFKNPEEVELLYRIGQAHFRLSEDQSDDVVKRHVEKGIDALSTALRLNDKHAEVHKWYGILRGVQAQYQPLKQKAINGLMLKKHCDMACALKPDDAVLYHILGRFDFEIAGLGWFQKTVAVSLLGETLNSTYSDALKKFMKAEDLSKRQHFNVKYQIENKKMIGETLVAMGKDIEAKKWFKEVKHLETYKIKGVAQKCY